ncbi:hypothetical protein [Atlantibacter sp.]|uniref:hypothetical protein n=1 Tax=Atlantibacter sp. TaxID=1903473 RepID=UPI0028AA3A75|nr:hypothetical protein [Atlantibacter sp.]
MEKDEQYTSIRNAQTLLYLYKSRDLTLLPEDIHAALRDCYRFDAGKPGLLLRMYLGADYQLIGMGYKCEALQNVAVEVFCCRQNHHLINLIHQAEMIMEDIRP